MRCRDAYDRGATWGASGTAREKAAGERSRGLEAFASRAAR